VGQASAFWKNDPHRLIVHNQFQAGTQPFEFTKNFRFTQLNMENVWAKAMNRVLSEKWTTERAVDEMIGRIKTVTSASN
jgi:multiple sugar transport system substrate-binding protein